MKPTEEGTMRRWPVNLIAKLVALILAITIFAAACGGGTETDPGKLVPEGSNLIVRVNLAGILSSDALASAVASVQKDDSDPQSLDDLLDRAIGETGIDFRRLSRLVVFADVSRSDDFTGFIVKGTFNEAAIVEALERLEGKSFATSLYKGRRVYSFEGDTDDQDLAFLEGDNLILGATAAVRAVIDVQEGDRRRASGAVPDALADLGQGLLSLAVEVPSEALPDDISELGNIPFLGDAGQGLSAILGPLQELEILGLAVAQNGQILILRVNLDFANEDSASSVGKVLEGALTLDSGLIPDAEVRELLESLEVSADGSRLIIRLEAAASEIGRLVKGLGDDQARPPEETFETDSIQVGIDSLMVDKGITEVFVPTTATNDFAAFDLDPGPGVAYLSDYLRQPTTNFYYCWDDHGLISYWGGASVTCPRPAISPTRGLQPIRLGEAVDIMPTKNHVAQGATVTYNTTPPTSGDHWDSWADCGFYEDGLPDELITHNLEHGNIVVSYNLAGRAQIDQLRAALDSIDLVEAWGVTRYYNKIPEGTVALAAWGKLDFMQEIDRDRMATFFHAFAGQLGPEVIAC
jgi:hypothetical protein